MIFICESRYFNNLFNFIVKDHLSKNMPIEKCFNSK